MRVRKLIVVFAVVMVFSSGAWGSWVDDQLAQSNSTSPSYFEGSKRGYYTGGSFSARWPQSNDYLLTISKPQLKSGCGGIDMFLGGFSFLNSDYLVQKLQRILAAAPAAAFDIALKTLLPQVSDTIKSLEAINDKLNNLQLDDCKAAKALVATAASPFSAVMSDSMNAELTAANADFLQSSGAKDLWNQVTKTFSSEQKSGGGSPTAKAASNAAITGCPAALKDIFGGGSVLGKIGEKKGIPEDYIASIRGYIGDVVVHTPNETSTSYKGSYLPPCGKNDFIAVVNGTAQVMGASGSCTDDTSANRNLVSYVSQKLTAIAGKLKARQAFSADEINFISSLPLPVGPALRAAVLTNTESQMIGKLADISAKGLAYNLMMDLVIRMRQMQEFAKHTQSTQNSADGGTPESCQLPLLAQPMALLQELEKNTMVRLDDAKGVYNNTAAELASIEALVAGLQKFDTIARQEVADRFGRGVSLRAVPR